MIDDTFYKVNNGWKWGGSLVGLHEEEYSSTGGGSFLSPSFTEAGRKSRRGAEKFEKNMPRKKGEGVGTVA